MALWDRTKTAFSKVFDPRGLNAANMEYITGQQAKRATSTLGMSEGQKEAQVARGQEQVGAATSAALTQLPAGVDAATQNRFFQQAAGGMQQTLAQQKMGADMASQEQAANASAELNALEQGAFQRRKEKRDFAIDAAGKAVEVAGQAGLLACWVAIALWGEDDPRTRLARFWCLSNRTHPFVLLYRRHGQSWARLVRRSRLARLVAWPIWRLMAHLGFRAAVREYAHG